MQVRDFIGVVCSGKQKETRIEKCTGGGWGGQQLSPKVLGVAAHHWTLEWSPVERVVLGSTAHSERTIQQESCPQRRGLL